MLKCINIFLICVIVIFFTFMPGSELKLMARYSASRETAIHMLVKVDSTQTQVGNESMDSQVKEVYTKIYEEAKIKQEMVDQSLLKKISYQVSYNGKIVKDYKREKNIIMGSPENYSQIKGVTAFRGNHFRNSSSYGYADIKEKKLEIMWNITIGSLDSWSGVGWNGQPAIVEWPEELRKRMNIKDEKKNKINLKEVLYAALDGNIYFLDIDDGKITRNPIRIPGPVKGSLTVDPRGIPMLYVGQGINNVNGRTVEIGYRVFSLIDQSKLFFINGKDSFAFRSWGAFDSTSIIDEKTDNMIICGENGLFYSVKLNTKYDIEKNKVNIDPQVIKYRYKIQGNNYQGIENSVAVYRNLAFFGDNGGWLQCVDLNTLKPIWIRNITDDTDSTVAIDEEGEDRVFLYTACEVDKQGSKGISFIRKIDALSGQLIWEKPYTCYSQVGQRPVNGGALASPVIGKGNISNMVIYNLARVGGFSNGKLIALDKNSGKEVWVTDLNNYCWSSPVDVYNENKEAYIIACDSMGFMFLIEGITGRILDRVFLGANIEGSPAIFENMVVVGTRGQKIFGVKIK